MDILYKILGKITRFQSRFWRAKKEKPKEDTRKLCIRNEDLESLVNSKPNESGILVLYKPNEKEMCSLGKVVLKEDYKEYGYFDELDRGTMLNMAINKDFVVAFYKNVLSEEEKNDCIDFSLNWGHEIHNMKKNKSEHYQMFKGYYDKKKELFITVYDKDIEFFYPQRMEWGFKSTSIKYEKVDNNKYLSYSKNQDSIREIMKNFDL